MLDFSTIISDAEASGLPWDFYEDAEDVSIQCVQTVPGQLIAALRNEAGPDFEQSIGLLAAYAARRSLICWFVYCESHRPLVVSDRTLQYWFSSEPDELPGDFHLPENPFCQGEPIRDCRLTDTASASSAVAHAARYTRTRSLLDAITALSHAYIAHSTSPLTRAADFVTWICHTAGPCSIRRERMTFEQEFAGLNPAAFGVIHRHWKTS